jgi:20S proteasome alpha/beta subunit
MTTIAYKDGVVAYDSLVTVGRRKHTEAAKVFRWNHALVGMCGSDCPTNDVVKHWLKSLLAEPKVKGLKNSDFELLIIPADGSLRLLYSDGRGLFLNRLFYAIGSGSDYAMGAMAHGASAEEAVRIAAAFDAYTGGKIRTKRRGK